MRYKIVTYYTLYAVKERVGVGWKYICARDCYRDYNLKGKYWIPYTFDSIESAEENIPRIVKKRDAELELVRRYHEKGTTVKEVRI